MSDHETPEELEGDVERRLSSKTTVRHLLRGCSTCQAAAWESLLFLKRAARGEPLAESAITDYSDAAFDRAASNALLALSLPPREQRRFLAVTSALRSGDGVLAITQSAEMSVQGLGIYEALLARSWALRYESPTEMCHLARVAMEVAGGLDPGVYGAARVMDLRARAWGELANAYRVGPARRCSGRAIQPGNREGEASGPAGCARLWHTQVRSVPTCPDRRCTMQWTEIRQRYPRQWLLIEAVEAHSSEGERILDDMAVIQSFPQWVTAWESYKKLHGKDPQRELYVLHTDREHLDIGEIRWLGLRLAS